MMNEIAIKKLEEMMSNEEFAQKVTDAGSYEKAYQILTENGLEASYDDFMAYIEESRKVLIEQSLITEEGELGIEMLDMVSGGGKLLSVAFWAGSALCFASGNGAAGISLAVAGVMAWKKK